MYIVSQTALCPSILDKPVCPSFAIYRMTGYPQNHYLFFKSFTGLLIKQFDDIYQTIESKYTKQEIKRLLYRRKDRKHRERTVGAGRRFKLDIKKQICYDFGLL